MTESWKYPVAEPLFTDTLLRELCLRDQDKPTAMATPYRYSDALNCARRLWFGANGVERTDPIDAPGVQVTSFGSYYHEMLQEALARRYPGACDFEMPSGIGTGGTAISGSADAVIRLWNGERWIRYLYELKTIGGFAYTDSIGVNGYKSKAPSGPRPSAIVQAGLNALGLGCDEVVIGEIAMEAVSKQRAEKLHISEFTRVLAEWHIPRDVWVPMAEDELHRLARIDALPEPPEGDMWDDGKWKRVNPNDSQPAWVCTYCPFRTACIAFEAGIDVIPSKEAMA